MKETDDVLPAYLQCQKDGCKSRLIGGDKLGVLPSTLAITSSLRVTDGWTVGDIFDFDNVAFSKPTSAGGTDGLRFLCCAECETGPVGYAILDGPAPVIIVDRQRVGVVTAGNAATGNPDTIPTLTQ